MATSLNKTFLDNFSLGSWRYGQRLSYFTHRGRFTQVQLRPKDHGYPVIVQQRTPLHGANPTKTFLEPQYTPATVKRYYHSSRVSMKEVTVPVPALAESISEGRVGTWAKKEGDSVAVDDVVVNLETDKVQVDVRSPVAGVIVKLVAEEGTDVRVGQPLFIVDDSASGAKSAAKDASKASGKAAAKPAAEAPPAESPKTKAPAKSKEQAAPPPSAQDQAQSKAQAPKQTATPDKAQAASAAAAVDAASAKPTAVKSTPGNREEKRVRMTKIRARIAQRLKESQNTAAMLTTFNEIDMHALMELRNKYKEAFPKKHGTKLGFMSAFVKASSFALREFPMVNATIDGDYIVQREFHDISVAVATPNGLLVPVIRDVQNMSFADIEKTIAELSQKGRDGKIALEDMAGGTFTISNGGVYGSLFGTPIINPPQSAVLGMHAINDRPHVVKGEIKIRPIMIVALTYDHRLIDGREAVLFLRKIKECIEDPSVMLLDL